MLTRGRTALLSCLLAVGCFRSSTAPEPEPEAEAEMPAANAGEADATPDEASAPDAAHPPPPSPAEEAVRAFELAFRAYCLCKDEGACDLWADQFGGASRACVVGLIERDDGLARCIREGSDNVRRCLETSCMECPVALLIEDSPLTELADDHCPSDRADAYGDALRAARNCIMP